MFRGPSRLVRSIEAADREKVQQEEKTWCEKVLIVCESAGCSHRRS